MNGGSKQSRLDIRLRQYQALAQAAESIAAHRDLKSLLEVLKERLQVVVEFDAVQILLYDPKQSLMRRHVLESTTPPGDYSELPIEESLAGLVWQTQQPLLITDLDSYESRYQQVIVELRQYGVKTAYFLPLTSQGRRLGALGFFSPREAAWGEDDQDFLEHVAKMVAVAVDDTINFESARAANTELKHRLEHLRLMLEITTAVVSELDLRELLTVISSSIREVIEIDIVTVALFDYESGQLRTITTDAGLGNRLRGEGFPVPLEDTPAGLAFTSGQPVLLDTLDLKRFPSEVSRQVYESGYRAGGSIPLIVKGHKLGVLGFACKRENAFSDSDKELLCQVANQIAIAVENALAFREIETLKNRLASEKFYLENEIRSEHNFEEIIGTSAALKKILRQVETVAPTDSAVLIRGETGTGKELLARAIHNLSARRERALVKLNCAAIPTGLLESELFGHEKGAFTGAISQRIGRFELAHKGTLFLDEVGDIPLELQPKLLRVLQEQEFERLGSTRTQRVDVRLVAATNSDLEQMVADKKYRSDLYYRLNVFPITIPPLRERREDIPPLARFFAQKYARRLKKRVESISLEAMDALTGYHWPGNVRELEHFIERAVILTQGPYLEVSLSELRPASPAAPANISPAGIPTLEAAEHEHILRALEAANWVIGGPNGAAARLGMKRTTLQYRMQKLGLERDGS